VTLTLPDDFRHVRPGNRSNAPVRFVLDALYAADGDTYETELVADYHANPSHWQSFPWGLAVAAGGFLFGGVVGRIGLGKKSATVRS